MVFLLGGGLVTKSKTIFLLFLLFYLLPTLSHINKTKSWKVWNILLRSSSVKVPMAALPARQVLQAWQREMSSAPATVTRPGLSSVTSATPGPPATGRDATHTPAATRTQHAQVSLRLCDNQTLYWMYCTPWVPVPTSVSHWLVLLTVYQSCPFLYGHDPWVKALILDNFVISKDVC